MQTRSAHKIFFGGWYQRTTLHLTEVYDLFSEAKSKLPFSGESLRDAKNNLDLISVQRLPGLLEKVVAKTSTNIDIEYFEDGLYLLGTEGSDVQHLTKQLELYYRSRFNPALSLIFSLGAPTPKVLARLSETHPITVLTSLSDPKKFIPNEEVFGKVYSRISSSGIIVHKTPGYIFVSTELSSRGLGEEIIQSQIFFREFKDQLERYLNIHRKVWEEITAIREQEYIKGFEIQKVVSILEDYQNTINLIASRISQMSSYVQTRAAIAKRNKIEEDLSVLFQFKFETLVDTHRYIQEIWNMTSRYISSSLEIVRATEARTLNSNLQSLQLITSVGVFSGLIVHLSRDKFPTVNLFGTLYLLGLMLFVWAVNRGIRHFYLNTRYKLKFPNTHKL